MNHYTYKITYTTGKYYIGVRSCTKEPKDDTSYIGSSKHTPNKLVLLKEILSTFKTRKEALQHEIYLHNQYDVANNDMFYNKAKQTSIGFDTTGTKLTEEHLKKVSNSLKNRVFTEEHKQKIALASTGRKKSIEERKKLSDSKKGVSTGPRTEETKLKISLANIGTEPWSKGKSFDNDYITDKYSSRVKYTEKFNWLNIKTLEEKTATCQEMGLLIGKKKSRFFILLMKGERKSHYCNWTFKN